MNLDIVSDPGIAIDVDILTNNASFPDACAFHDVREMPDLCTSTDLCVAVKIGRLMNEVGELWFLGEFARFERNSAVQQRTLTGVKNSQDAQAFGTTADRTRPEIYAIKEMLAFRP